MKRLIIIILIVCFTRILVAQPYYFRRYQVENGLSNNTVFCTAQDDKGFMWFGTKDGLNRFDGYSFKTYRHDPERKGSLGNDLIYAVHVDQQNTLWTGTNDGIFEYKPSTESFLPLAETKGMRIIDMISDHTGNLWFTSSFKLYRYNKLARKLYSFSKEVNFDASALMLSASGQVWVSTGRGTVECYDVKTNSFKSYSVNGNNQKPEYGWVSKMVETKRGLLLIGTTNQGLKLLNPVTHQSQSIITLNDDKTPVFVRDIKQTAANEFWIGTESGIYIYNDQTGKIINLRKQYNNDYSLSDNAIYTIFKDRDGGVWTGSYFGGVNYYSTHTSLFTKYFPQKASNSISGNDVREITKDDKGNFWIGTEDAGLNKLNPKTGIFKHFLPDGKKGSISYANIHGLLVDEDKLWVGTFEHGLDLFDLKTEQVIKHYQAGVGNRLRTNFIVTFCKTRKGQIIVATINGIYEYNRKTDDFEPIPGLPFLFYDSLIEDPAGNIWAGSFNDGVFRFNLNQTGFTNFRNDPDNPVSISHNTINSIFVDSQNNIWVTTDGGGLCRYYPKTNRFSRYGLKNGFPSNYLFRIQEDYTHKFWISSTRGLIHFDPQSGMSKTYSKTNGLLTDQFNYSSAYKDINGQMYFGSVKGLISFDPHAFTPNTIETRVFLTGFQVNGPENSASSKDPVFQKSIIDTDTITLNFDQSSFSIDFAALSYQSPEMTEYAYKMTGLYKDWEYLKTNRKVYFTKLAPGSYTLEVKALLEGSSTWSTKNVKLLIRVLPPFYLNTWAYLIYIALSAAVILILVRRYHRKIQLKNSMRMEAFEHEKQKEVYQAKIEFFTNVAHEIRTPLTLIIGPMEKLIKQAKDVPAIEKNLRIMDRNTDRLLKLTNQLLDFRKTETSGFSLNFVQSNITEILKDVALQFQPAAEQNQMSCNLQLPEQRLMAYIDVEAFYKIMSNLFDNAIKYGKSHVQIALETDDKNGKFYVWVQSDGNKIPVELENKIFEPFFRARETAIKTGTGIGLSISRSLAQLHNGKLYLHQNPEGVNIFVLELPVHQLIEFNLNGQWEKL
ncbi:two-component regulator propeller domain-containing protein [Pedobacter frigidisoli]|uniref:ligand-binding sensor domain-containing protein n=1 Tax=Pedobacter frigidisoli TaxID=2530455 RepID=UPI0029307205|nr:two-component regulator propeller domain-containing protein [Pedobacter frigidisoli]